MTVPTDRKLRLPQIEDALESPAARRNAGPILSVLRAHLPAKGRVLEIAAGTGLHAAAFAEALPGLDWTPTDPDPASLVSIDAWRSQADAPNLRPAQQFDVRSTWPEGPFDAVLCVNMIHISPWAATEALMAGADQTLARPGGLLVLYGPYLEPEVETAPSNLAFDADLKRRNPEWGLREREAVVDLARHSGLILTRRVAMPANNLMLLFRSA
jgi:SAM-dependent methyltransferase